MTVLNFSYDWNSDLFDSAMPKARLRSGVRDVKPSGDWSPRKKFFCLVAASLASWVILLAPIYVLVQFV